MRRTVVIDDKLLEEAKKEFGTKGIRETIETCLQEAVRRRRLDLLRRSLGTFDLGLTPEDLEKMRDDSCRTGAHRQLNLDGSVAEETEERATGATG